jgi:hypothetical protein
MARLKKYRIHKAICDVCNGNGYVKVVHIDQKNHIHQCWECDSEGEFYIYEDNINYGGDRNTYKFLH